MRLVMHGGIVHMDHRGMQTLGQQLAGEAVAGDDGCRQPMFGVIRQRDRFVLTIGGITQATGPKISSFQIRIDRSTPEITVAWR